MEKRDLLTFTNAQPTHQNFLACLMMNITNIRLDGQEEKATPTSVLAGLSNMVNAFFCCSQDAIMAEKNPLIIAYEQQISARKGGLFDLVNYVGIGGGNIQAISESEELSTTFVGNGTAISNGVIALIREHISTPNLFADERKAVNAHIMAHQMQRNEHADCGTCASEICSGGDDAKPSSTHTVVEVQELATRVATAALN